VGFKSEFVAVWSKLFWSLVSKAIARVKLSRKVKSTQPFTVATAVVVVITDELVLDLLEEINVQPLRWLRRCGIRHCIWRRWRKWRRRRWWRSRIAGTF